jgi:hypothetical protein
MQNASIKPNPFDTNISTTIDKFSRRPTKRVEFYKKSMVFVFHPKTNEDMKASWYSSEEMKGFRRDKRADARELRKSGGTEVVEHLVHSILKEMPLTAIDRSDLDHICGLETSLVPHVGKSLLTLRAARIKEVLDEQSRQKKLGMDDAEMIAEISEKISSFARDWGNMIAVINELIASNQA